LDKDKKSLIEKILHEIAEDIIVRFEKGELGNNIGLLSGKSGVSLFMFYASRYFNNERYEKYAQLILEGTFKDINEGSLFPTYCTGLAGVGWAINHLVENGFIGDNNLSLLVDFDEYLDKIMDGYARSNNFDFLHGATGIAFYFTKRANSNPKVKDYLYDYVQKLKTYAIFDEVNKTAKIISTILDENEKPKEVYNLSLSHGMSSIIIILCKVAGITDGNADCIELIKGFSNYIISNETIPDKVTFSRYPSCVELININPKTSSRLSWCYGDIGNGFAFLNAYKILCDENYIVKAKDVFDSLETRNDVGKQLIRDSGVCHGSAGINVICKNLKRFHNQNIYDELIEHWLGITLSFYKSKNYSLEGFSMFTTKGYEYELGILNGTSGVGLSFLSNLNENYLNWTEMLLID